MNTAETVGSLSVRALALAKDAATRGILSESTRATYLQLRERISHCLDGEELLLEPGLSPRIWTRVSLAIEESIEQRARIMN